MTGSLGMVGLFTSTASSAASNAAATDFSFTANVTAGRAYSLGLHTRFVGTNYSFGLNVTDGTTSWRLSSYLQSATTQWYGGWRSGGTLNKWGMTEQLYIPAVSGNKTFTIQRTNVTGSGVADSVFVASADGPRQFWLRDLGQYPVAADELGLVGYAESTSTILLQPSGGTQLDPLSITATFLGTARYRAVYRGQFDCYSPTPAMLFYDGVANYSGFNFPTNVPSAPELVCATLLPSLSGTKTLRPSCASGQINAMGTPDCPRQFWLERVA